MTVVTNITAEVMYDRLELTRSGITLRDFKAVVGERLELKAQAAINALKSGRPARDCAGDLIGRDSHQKPCASWAKGYKLAVDLQRLLRNTR